MKSTAVTAGCSLFTKHLDMFGGSVNLMASVTGIAASLLEEKAEAQIFPIAFFWGFEKICNSAGFLDELQWNSDLSRSVEGVNNFDVERLHICVFRPIVVVDTERLRAGSQ